MGAEQLARLLVEDDLHEALILAQRNGFAVADEGKAADADVELFVLRRLLGKADGSDLRRAIGAAGISPVTRCTMNFPNRPAKGNNHSHSTKPGGPESSR